MSTNGRRRVGCLLHPLQHSRIQQSCLPFRESDLLLSKAVFLILWVLADSTWESRITILLGGIRTTLPSRQMAIGIPWRRCSAKASATAFLKASSAWYARGIYRPFLFFPISSPLSEYETICLWINNLKFTGFLKGNHFGNVTRVVKDRPWICQRLVEFKKIGQASIEATADGRLWYTMSAMFDAHFYSFHGKFNTSQPEKKKMDLVPSLL